MNKAKDKNNILTDLYNLKLSENQEQDKPMIIEFFKKYDPNFTKYLTKSDVEGKTDALDMAGSLGWFELIAGKSWFETEQVKNFYSLWHLVKEIIDGKINNEITQFQIFQIESLTKDTTPSLLMGNKETRQLTGPGWIPEKIDPRKYEFIQGVHLPLDTISSDQNSTKIVLKLSVLKYQLWKAFLQFLNGETVIRKCLASDCQRAFIPITLKQVYHSDTCRARVGKRRERNKIDYVIVN